MRTERGTLQDSRPVGGRGTLFDVLGALFFVNDGPPPTAFRTFPAEVGCLVSAANAAAAILHGLPGTSYVFPVGDAFLDRRTAMPIGRPPDGAWWIGGGQVDAKGAQRLVDGLERLLAGAAGSASWDARFAPSACIGFEDPMAAIQQYLDAPPEGRIRELIAFAKRGPFRIADALPQELGGPTNLGPK